jgi:hypothetical protein
LNNLKSKKSFFYFLGLLSGVILLIVGIYLIQEDKPASIISIPPESENISTATIKLPQKPLIAEGIQDELKAPTKSEILIAPENTPTISFDRAGFDMSINANPELWASRLGAAWYLNWGVKERITSATLDHWKTIRITPEGYKPGLQEIRELVAVYPGSVWILGNEPDVVVQDNILPELYATSYHELYYTIKSLDDTASIAVAGVAQGTPLRMQYLDRVLDIYVNLYGENMPVDWWTVHGYVLREERNSWGVGIPPGINSDQGILYEVSDHGRLDYFEAQIRDFRAWMAARGYRNAPLALTEFGILMPSDYGFPTDYVAQYLKDTFGLLQTMRDIDYGYALDGNQLVQRWAWFSLADPTYTNSNLADFDQDNLTPVGLAFRESAKFLESP